MESGFDGKVIWYANGLGAIYDFLTLKLALPLFLLGSIMLLVSIMMRLKLSSEQGVDYYRISKQRIFRIYRFYASHDILCIMVWIISSITPYTSYKVLLVLPGQRL